MFLHVNIDLQQKKLYLSMELLDQHFPPFYMSVAWPIKNNNYGHVGKNSYGANIDPNESRDNTHTWQVIENQSQKH